MRSEGFQAAGGLTPDAIRRGLPAAYIDDLVARGFDRGRVLHLVGAGSTLRRKLRDNATLSREESDRLARVARIVQRATEVFGSQEKAAHWLNRPSRQRTDGTAPLDMLDTDPGSEWVEERLAQIAHGLFA